MFEKIVGCDDLEQARKILVRTMLELIGIGLSVDQIDTVLIDMTCWDPNDPESWGLEGVQRPQLILGEGTPLSEPSGKYEEDSENSLAISAYRLLIDVTKIPEYLQIKLLGEEVEDLHNASIFEISKERAIDAAKSIGFALVSGRAAQDWLRDNSHKYHLQVSDTPIDNPGSIFNNGVIDLTCTSAYAIGFSWMVISKVVEVLFRKGAFSELNSLITKIDRSGIILYASQKKAVERTRSDLNLTEALSKLLKMEKTLTKGTAIRFICQRCPNITSGRAEIIVEAVGNCEDNLFTKINNRWVLQRRKVG